MTPLWRAALALALCFLAGSARAAQTDSPDMGDGSPTGGRFWGDSKAGADGQAASPGTGISVDNNNNSVSVSVGGLQGTVQLGGQTQTTQDGIQPADPNTLRENGFKGDQIVPQNDAAQTASPRTTAAKGSWLGNLFRGRGGRPSTAGANAAPDGHPADDPGSGSTPETDTGRRGSQAFSKAKSLADSFKGALRSDEGAGAAQGAGAARALAAGLPSGAGIDPANPKTMADFQIAAQTGFKSSFAAVGLKPGVDRAGGFAVLDGSGKPASPADLQRLRAQIGSDPTALMRYPDLFQTVPRERFERLKASVADHPELQSSLFKDIGLTADKRDLNWKRSCAKVSGDCNEHVKTESYKKGEALSPDDLDDIFKDIAQEQREQDIAASLGGHRIGAHLKLPDVGGEGGSSFSGGQADASYASAIDLRSASPAQAFERALGGAQARSKALGLRQELDVPSPLSAKSREARLAAVLGVGGATLLFAFLLLRRRDEKKP